jgi:hypothetical protein
MGRNNFELNRVLVRRDLYRLVCLVAGDWPVAGFVDTEIGCFMKPEVVYAAKTVWA